jgi:superfamily I DNA and/or RNA helicase/very-short-patch-repair endonuclease
MVKKSKDENKDKSEDKGLIDLLNTRIEKLRIKLLDLTRRNPLLATKFSDRSHSHIRVVDELPQILFEKMNNGIMKFVPLPPLEEDPKDEMTQEFQNALSAARLTDEVYINKCETIDQDSEDSVDQMAVVERELRDQLREEFGLRPRQTKTNITLVHHARNNKIRPEYELPLTSEVHSDGRHEDNFIQTLLLPDLFERRLNSLISKCSTWRQETGINVLKAAFGFLEWKESPTSDPSLAPLILLPTEIEKKKTRGGYEYSVSGQDENPEINTVLAEKMRRDFGLELPAFDLEQMTVEEYFSEVRNLKLHGKRLEVKRRVAIGVFPSARMVMYYDLNTSNYDFAEHETINELLLGSEENATETPFGDEYEVDDPKIEAKVGCIVMDSDSSQFSSIVDVMDGKNIAVEGPPGTGKSQTIVNTIAATLSAGKKILFVAEKMAALEVVRSRLEACGMGEFLLTLQANRSSKANVYQSIRERMSLSYIIYNQEPQGFDKSVARFNRTRSELNQYIEIISSVFSETNFTVHEILGWGISARCKLSEYSLNLEECEVPNLNSITKESLREIIDSSNQLEAALVATNSHQQHWSFVKRANIDPYSADEILKLAQDTAKSCTDSDLLRAKLICIEQSNDVDCEELEKLKNALCEIKKYSEAIDIELVENISNDGALNKINTFFKDREDAYVISERLGNIYTHPLDNSLPQKLENLAKIVNEMSLQNLDINTAKEICERINNKFLLMKKGIEIVEEAGRVEGFFLNKTIRAVVAACDIGRSIQRSILALRKETLEPALVKILITKSSETCNSLKQKKEELEKVFYFKSFNNHEINSNCEIFIKSGLFAIFSSKYRIAKRAYISMSRDKKFKKAKAISQSKVLLNWIEEVKCFNKSDNLLEDCFDGLETDYKSLEELMNYYDQIDTKLSGVENKEVRHFLKRGDIDSILALPKIDNDHAIRSSNNHLNRIELSENIDQAKANYERFKNYIKDLESLKSVFVDCKYVDVSLLSEAGNELVAFQERWNALNDNEELKRSLGKYFKGIDTDREKIQSSIDMTLILSDLRGKLGNTIMLVFKKGSINESIVDLEVIINIDARIREEISKLAKLVNANIEDIILSRSKQELSLFLNEAGNNKKGLLAFSVAYANMLDFNSRGFGSIIDMLMLPEGKVDGLADIVVAVIGQLLAREVYEEYGNVLASYNGSKLNDLRQRLAVLDKEIIKLSRKKLRVQLYKNSSPPNGVGRGKKSEWTNMSLLQNEIGKKTRHISVRDLTKRAGKALLEIKPCWMMSPLAVAQYIEKGEIEFDLLIIDEASQMTPEDSIGALSRSKQAMIVGDVNQLPPSSFFKKYFDDSDDDEDETVTEQSILEMANSVFRPARRLKWHYRSKHPGLIAFSNKYVYDNDMIVFSSPNLNNEKQGVSFMKVDGFYKAGTNPIESSVMANAIIDFMRNNKDMSLGVVIMNLKQRDLLLEEIEYAISHDSVASRYVEYWQSNNDGLESFFVKNLENVQGDERDVIFIGTVYGPEKEGAPVMQRFGPINGITGKRRLNVLFSRAKHKIITFSSMNSNDIKVKEGGNEGVELLKYWLEYSVTGKLLEVESTGREPDSKFEEYVIAQLKAIGCQTVPQVGVTGYFIDIGVKHPDWPHGFIMGVECDGATYHSSKSARDRDRLRQEVLEGLGWYLHRIWSTDWFNDPLSEVEKLRNVVKSRLIELKSGQERKVHVDNSEGNSSSADNDELTRLGHQASLSFSNKSQASSPASSSLNNNDNIINGLDDSQKKVYYHIKEYGDKTVLETTELFCVSPDTYSIKPKGVKNILEELVKLGLIYMYESDDKKYYSTNIS